MNGPGEIKHLRKFSIILFLLSFSALIGSLLAHNILVSFKYSKVLFPLNLEPGTKILCEEKNNYCEDILDEKKYVKTLDDCNKFHTHLGIFYDDKYISEGKYNKLKISKIEKKEKSKLSNFFVEVRLSENKNFACIKNSNFYKTYKMSPLLFNFMSSIKENSKYRPGTGNSINPFIYGETSISNIAKRFPQNYIFKSLLFISAIFMYLYWKYNNIIYRALTKNHKNNLFLLFGYCSAIFLFMHVLLLGQNFDLKIFKILKRMVIIFFILFEILAQFYLIRAIKINLLSYINYINENIFKLKMILIYSVILITVMVLSILIFRDLTKEVDYILEWNYFTVLLFYYLLSFLMWKKN